MAKQLNINLGFTADTSAAKAQITSLQNELTKLTHTPVSLLGGKSEQEIGNAIKGVIELQQHLKTATNINTGSLDFAKLSDSVKKSGTSIQAYGEKLRSLGPMGQNAFNQLAQAVAQSEIPIRRSNALLTEFATTLKNTVRWQLSSSMLHSFMGGLQSAVGYAKDLNRSLNDIRIVTGYNIDQMTAFAESANKAAKKLSTTTTDYTKASLIYFQQGLSDADVKQRTDITIKMANVSRQSAEIVSDQMTAVWNNFADGTQTLESFADAMVALGAKTASSSDEIANGLEKFAAIGQTIGLSFDYASAALATITAKTRQSEEVVGTALKTIFARIQGLKVGEILEDGTDLNKYSSALAAYGIHIKDNLGNLRDMDDILDDMGRKWKTLAKDEQVALAQTVAGVRQYNQLVSLMDNWDFMEENLKTVQNSTGALDKQAEIYEESWEAASKRVRASMEGIFNDLINDKAFISILNVFEDILSYVDNLIKGFGGLQGVLMTLGAYATKLFSSQIAQGLTTMVNNVRLITKSGQQAYQKEKATVIENFANSIGGGEVRSAEDKARSAYLKGSLTLQQDFIDNETRMSELEKETNKALLDRNKILGENAIKAAKAVDETQDARSDIKIKIQTQIAEHAYSEDSYNGAQVYDWENTSFQEQALGLEGILTQQEAVKASMKILGDESLETSKKIELITQELKESGKMSAKEIEKIEEELKDSGEASDVLIQKLGKLQMRETKKKAAMVYGYEDDDVTAEYEGLSDRNEEVTNTGVTKRSTEEYTDAIRANIIAKRKAKEANHELGKSEKEIKDNIDNAKGAQKDWANTLVAAANGITSLFSAINMLKGAWNVIQDPDMSGWDKFLSIASTLTMTIPLLISGMTGLKTIWSGLKAIANADTLAKGLNAAATWLQIEAEKHLQKQKKKTKDITKKDTEETNKNTVSKAANAASDNLPGGKRKGIKINGKTLQATKSPSKLGTKAPVGKVSAKVPAGSSIKTTAGGFKTLSSAAGNLAKSLGTVAKAFGGVAAGIAIAVAAISVASYLYNKDANEAKKAAKIANQAAEEFSKAQTAYEEFMNKMNSYREGQNGLSKLTKGTVEYREELVKANEAALDLIHTYDLMADEYKTVDGRIEITQKGLDRIREQELEKLEMAQSYSTTMNQQAKTAQLKADQTKFNREYAKGSGWSKEDTAWMFGAAGTGAGIGMAIGTIIPGIGNAIGAAVGAGIGLAVGGIVGTIGAIAGKDSEKEEDQALKILQNAYEEKGEAIFVDGGIRAELEGKVSEKLIQSLEDNVSETQEMVKALHANIAAIEASIVATAGSANIYNDSYQELSDEDKKLADLIIGDQAAQTIADPESEEYKAAEKEVKKLFDWRDKDAYEEYLKARYGDEASNYRVVNKGGTNATLQQKNEDGSWENIGEKNTLTNAEVIKFLTETKLKGFGDEELEILNSINALGDRLEDIPSIDLDAISEIKTSLAAGDGVDLTLMSPEQKEALKSEVSTMGAEVSQEHIDAITTAIENYDVDAYKARLEHEADAIIQAGAEEMDTTTGALEAYTDELMRTNEVYAENKKLAAEAAVETFKFSKSLDELESVVSDNIDNIKNFNKTNLECYESLGAVQKALKKTFGMEVDGDFIAKNIDLIAKAAEGNEEAVKKLGAEMSKNFVENLQIAEENIKAFKDLDVDEGLQIGDYVYASLEAFTNSFNTAKNNVLSYIDEIQQANLKIGDSLSQALGPDDIQTFVDSLNTMAMATQMSVSDMKAMLSSMGVQAKVEQTWVPQNVKVPIYETTTEVEKVGNIITGDGRVVRTSTRQVDEKEMPGGQYVASITYDGSKPSTDIISTGGRKALSTPSTGKKSGGGGSKANKENKNREEEFDRYYDEIEAVNKYTKALEKASKKKDQLWGPDRQKAMKEEIKVYSGLIEKQEEYIKAISGENGNGGFLEIDQNNLQKYGGQFVNGELVNYYEMTDSWLKDYNDAVDAYNASDKGEDAKAKFNEADKLYQARKKAFEQWKTTKELNDAEKAKLEEYIATRQEAVYEDIIYEVEFKLEVNDRELKKLDYYINKISGDFYKAVEAFGKMKDKLEVYLKDDLLESFEKQKQQLEDAYKLWLEDPEADGAINQQQFEEGMSALLDNTYATAEAIQKAKEELKGYYGEILEQGVQQLEDFTDQFDQLLGALTHYENILSLLGRDKDYQLSNDILTSQIEILNDSLEASRATLAFYEEQETMWNKVLNSSSSTKEQKENAKKNLQLISEYKQEEQEKYYNFLEQLGEAAKKKLENSLEQSKRNIEQALTGGSSFDTIFANFERLNKYQEEYLTNTNKIYETNKLISKTQQAIDKTNNKAAKQKYNEYIKYLEQLQKTEQLSNYDLSVAQKKFEILQAQIALEEARNAKDTVRLSRDSEGNFGYVYTANADRTNEAEQNLLDRQNELYNISLEGSKQYLEKYWQTLQEGTDAMHELWVKYYVEHSISEEEFNQESARLQQYYQEQANSYLSIYQQTRQDLTDTSYLGLQASDGKYYGDLQTTVGLTEDFIYDKMIGPTNSGKAHLETFSSATETEFKKCKGYAETWKTETVPLVEEVGNSYDTTKKKLQEFTKKSGELVDEYTDPKDGVLKTISDTITKVGNLTIAWSNSWSTIDTTITKYEKLASAIEDTLSKVGDVDTQPPEADDTQPPEAVDTQPPEADDTQPPEANNTQPPEANNTQPPEAVAEETTKYAYKVSFKDGTVIEISDYKYDSLAAAENAGRSAANRKGLTNKVTITGGSDNLKGTEVGWPSFYIGDLVKNKKQKDGFMKTYKYQSGDMVDNLFPKWVGFGNSELGEITDVKYYKGQYYYKTGQNEWVKGLMIQYDTGGYTGSWGPEGKMAMLHEKELVLNKHDTENFLTATNILREISDMLDNNALIASLGAINLSAMSINSPADQIVQQEVNIHADFPNVVDHNEIEIAIDNLINAASQHAYRQ